MKVSFDASICAGHAQCAAHGPDVYELDDVGYLVPPPSDVPAHLHRQARDGAAACPERALTIEE